MLSITVPFLSAAAVAASTLPPPNFADALGAVLQGDGRRGMEIARSIPDEGLSQRDAEARQCMLDRVGRRGPLPASGVARSSARSLLEAYEAYWSEAVLGAPERAAAEAVLLGKLRKLLAHPRLQNIQDAEPLVAERLKRSGYYSLQGETGVLHELMMWSTQPPRDYAVELPEGTRVTRVYLLDGFATRGWSSYLTCGRMGTGGWTKPEGLYAVVPAYPSLDDENFRVNFLAHESQHFADLQRFPDLKDWEKEYRAKLVEVAMADTTLKRVLARFMASQGPDPADAHSYANHRLQALRDRTGIASDDDLSSLSPDALRQAARAELGADTAMRERQRRSEAIGPPIRP